MRRSFERWDGRGEPEGLAGEAIPLPMRIARLAADTVVWQRLAGPEAALSRARAEAGRVYDPDLVAVLLAGGPAILDGHDRRPARQWVLGAEPGPPAVLTGRGLERALLVAADFADLKSPLFTGLSRRGDPRPAASRGGGGPARCARPRPRPRGGLRPRLGEAGSLSDDEWEQVRLHPYYTERAVARTALEELGRIGAAHHEQPDGRGYPHGASGQAGAPRTRGIVTGRSGQWWSSTGTAA